MQFRVRRRSGNDLAVTVNLKQEQSRQMSQTSFLDRFSCQWTAIGNEHLDGVFARVVGETDRRTTIR